MEDASVPVPGSLSETKEQLVFAKSSKLLSLRKALVDNAIFEFPQALLLKVVGKRKLIVRTKHVSADECLMQDESFRLDKGRWRTTTLILNRIILTLLHLLLVE